MSSIPLPKPAAARTLKTKYAELASTTGGRIDVSTEKGKEISELLHRFFAACSRVCLKNSLIRNFGVFSAISASSILDLALLSLRIYSLN